MNRPIARTLGALALAAALATSSTAAFAATPTGSPAFYATKTTQKRVDTLVGLSRQLSASAVQQARSLKGEGGTSQSGESDKELNLMCNGDWFITWDEDANGNAVVGSYNLHCAGTVIGIG